MKILTPITMKWIKKTGIILIISLILFSPLLMMVDFKYVAVVFITWVFMVIYYVFRIRQKPHNNR